MRASGVVVALDGVSASGKSSAAALAAPRLGAALVAEAVDRLWPAPALRFRNDPELLRLETRLLEEDARRYETARALARAGAITLVDTGFLGTVSYTAGLLVEGRCRSATFETLVGRAISLATENRLGFPDLTLWLRPPTAAVLDRRAARDPARHPLEFRERHREVGAFEYQVVRPWLRSWTGGRVADVDASAPLERVVAAVVRRARSATGHRSRSRDLERALRSLVPLDRATGPSGVLATFKKRAQSGRAPRP